jgi:rfaE bifunctional protein nucleotidyltransferase chain/domain/rfaE bifunctional protein kinase chain/domain
VSPGRLTVVGDALLDRDVEGAVDRLCPDAPVPVVERPVERARPGGAGLAALLAARDGWEVTLVTALADDGPGHELRGLLETSGVAVADLRLRGTTPEKVRILGNGRPLARLDRGGPSGAVGALTAAARAAVGGGDAILVSDYGRGVARRADVREALGAAAAGGALVWDPHPRGPAPVPGARLATPNAGEAGVARDAPDALAAATRRAGALCARWSAHGVVVTLGARGAVYVGEGGAPLAAPAPSAAGGDPCGAGDRFSAAAACLLAGGAHPTEAVAGAVEAASAFVAEGGARAALDGGPVAPNPPGSAAALVRRVRARGGTVVAAGGCFDLLHAGHVRMLQAARALGDCLVVLLNSDASVRRLKGQDRPLVPEEDRAAVLAGLGCVDAVVRFDEDAPVRALERLRPHVFAKGADYAIADLPEAAAMARWGGQAVILPYTAGRSTTKLIEEAARVHVA